MLNSFFYPYFKNEYSSYLQNTEMVVQTKVKDARDETEKAQAKSLRIVSEINALQDIHKELQAELVRRKG